MSPAANNRNTIYVEDALIQSNEVHPERQFVMRLAAPKIANSALPGSFVHLRCADSLAMRRPMSVMRADASAGCIDILYKAHGLGTNLLAQRRAGERLSLMGPIGKPFKLHEYRSKPLLIGGGVGIPPMVFLAEHLRRTAPVCSPLVLMGSEIPFPFTARPSTIMVPGPPADTIAAMPLLEDWGIASRLASTQGYPGCFTGMVTDLARSWLQPLDAATRDEVEIFACGPTPMLRAVAKLAHEFQLPCEISVEEYMACAVGGCAGCTVRIRNEGVDAMKRVCVDGPVFDASTVVFT